MNSFLNFQSNEQTPSKSKTFSLKAVALLVIASLCIGALCSSSARNFFSKEKAHKEDSPYPNPFSCRYCTNKLEELGLNDGHESYRACGEFGLCEKKCTYCYNYMVQKFDMAGKKAIKFCRNMKACGD